MQFHLVLGSKFSLKILVILEKEHHQHYKSFYILSRIRWTQFTSSNPKRGLRERVFRRYLFRIWNTLPTKVSCGFLSLASITEGNESHQNNFKNILFNDLL